MKLYSSHYILQQKLANTRSVQDIQNLCSDLNIRLEVQILTSAFSNLKWTLSNNQLSGRFLAHIITTIFQDNNSDWSLTSDPEEFHFESQKPLHNKEFEMKLFETVRQSLHTCLKKLLA